MVNASIEASGNSFISHLGALLQVWNGKEGVGFLVSLLLCSTSILSSLNPFSFAPCPPTALPSSVALVPQGGPPPHWPLRPQLKAQASVHSL